MNKVNEVNENTTESFEYFPLCKISNNKQYESICDKIQEHIISIKKKCDKNILKVGNLKPIECCVLTHQIDIFKNIKYHEFTPNTIYNIINLYDNNEEAIKNLIDESSKIKNIISNMFDKEFKRKNIKWNIEHNCWYGGETNDIFIFNKYKLIGFNKKKCLPYYISN